MKNHTNKKGLKLILGICLLPFLGNAQFITSTSPQTSYPTTGTTALNLDRITTKYLSNYNYPASGTLTGNTIEIAGWSTDNDGGFTYGKALTSFPYTYTGDGAIAIPNAKDVQVGYLEAAGKRYIITAYYDVIEQMYAYDLYDYAFIPPSTTTVTKLYTYHFKNMDGNLAPFTPSTDYYPSIPGAIPPSYFPRPNIYTMAYNRISMDISGDALHVAIVMTNKDNERMYLAAGQAVVDSVIFSPYLPPSATYAAATTSSGFATPVPAYTYPTTPEFTWVANGSNWDGFDSVTGIYVRYDGTDFYYSYYEIDENRFITVVSGTTGYVTAQTGFTTAPYSPLIAIKAHSSVTTPGLNEYFNQIWPDVCFSSNKLRMVCYINNPMTTSHPISGQADGAEDLYVSSEVDFADYYNFTGNSTYGPTPTYSFLGPNHFGVDFYNTFDGRPLRESPTTMFLINPEWTTFDFESLCKSLPIVTGEDIRAKIDAPDASTGNYAITFAYSGVPSGGYSADYPISVKLVLTPTTPSPSLIPLSQLIHSSAEFGKKNIYVRYGNYGSQAILTNNSIAAVHTPINTSKNIDPSVSFEPSSNSKFAVAWTSEQAGVSGQPWSYVAVKIDKSIPYGSAGYRLNPDSYLRIPNNPSLANNYGDFPAVSLSKRQMGLSTLYTAFLQEDATPTYTVQHQNHQWVSTATWRTSSIGANVAAPKLSVGPNPFSNQLHITGNADIAVELTDISGKKLLQAKGNTEEINKKLDNLAVSLVAGTYFVKVLETNSGEQTFKVSKQ